MSWTATTLEVERTELRQWQTLGIDIASGPTADRCRTRFYVIMKRAIDLPIAVLLLVVLAPLMLALALAVRLSSPGPALFRQKRIGRDARIFHCLKFRSMRVDAERALRRNPRTWASYVANDYKLPASEDPRITRFGRFLRKTSLDELPQLINVIRGEMSLVGPRPIVGAELDEYGERSDDLLAALPGITGKWQVSGRSRLHYPERANVELSYVYGWSPIEDLRILLRTVPVVLSRDGAH
jgi:lipopolysaccharide/colanic/teichoic acid biosynthesis glycosyltransferase